MTEARRRVPDSSAVLPASSKAVRRAVIAVIVCLLTFSSSSVHGGWRIQGEVKYDPPPPRPLLVSAPENVRLFRATEDEVWKATVRHLSSGSFAIDQIEKDSGLVMLSFNVDDPRPLIECGHVRSWVSNMRGRRDYSFDAASAKESYELLIDGGPWTVTRSLSLSGKVNVLLIQDGVQSAVRVNAHYIVQKTTMARFPLDYLPPRNHFMTLSFATGEVGTDNAGTQCQSTFILESRILNGIERQLPPSASRSPQEIAAAGIVVGTSQDEVLKIIGRERDGFEVVSGREAWIYVFPKSRVVIAFVDRRVVSVDVR